MLNFHIEILKKESIIYNIPTKSQLLTATRCQNALYNAFFPQLIR